MLLVSLIFISIGIILILTKLIFRYFNNNYPKKIEKDNIEFAILIPARDESKVIEDLLISIENQSININPKDIYVIVEDINDKTVNIANKRNINIFIRKKLNLKRKGYALMEVVEDITKKKEYDAYFIFDADNVLDKDYFKEMLKTYKDGYDIGIGYRNIKNKYNSIAVSSSLIFTIVNVISNKNRSKYSINCNASGTGFYISGRVINKLKTYPFHTLTEDYELSLYACINNLTTYYNEKAMFYDEQPINYKTYFKQRTRWVKGYFEARSKYIKDLFKKLRLNNPNFASIYNSIIGIYDLLFIVIGLIILSINLIIKNNYVVLILLLLIYLILCLFTIYLLNIEKRYNIDTKLKIKTIFIHPLLLLTYIPCLIKCIFTKNVKWYKIEHGVDKYD